MLIFSFQWRPLNTFGADAKAGRASETVDIKSTSFPFLWHVDTWCPQPCGSFPPRAWPLLLKSATDRTTPATRAAHQETANNPPLASFLLTLYICPRSSVSWDGTFSQTQGRWQAHNWFFVNVSSMMLNIVMYAMFFTGTHSKWI